MKRMITSGYTLIVDEIEVEYGRMPKSINNNVGDLLFYFETRHKQENHDSVVEKAIRRLVSEIEAHGVRWIVTHKDKIEDYYYYQLTIVVLRVRDSY